MDRQNQPILRVEYIESDDVRDKLVRQFIDKIGYSFTKHSLMKVDSGTSEVIIEPVSDRELIEITNNVIRDYEQKKEAVELALLKQQYEQKEPN